MSSASNRARQARKWRGGEKAAARAARVRAGHAAGYGLHFPARKFRRPGSLSPGKLRTGPMPGDTMPAPTSPAPEAAPETAPEARPEAPDAALDGVRYARLSQSGAAWRLASLSPLWREEVAGLPPEPDAAALEALASRGIWLARDTAAPPLAVMCCGLGSLWPGMGRELYDNFPAARDAMDRVAALADWDILGLMDETDAEAVSDTRRQIPYLFLLEYAQWSQFASLGIAPALFCGHSLGELIALSLSGIYGLSEAWYILDTRAEHMAELEATATRDTGMMAVHAEAAVIDEIRAAWPDLYISNRNTPRQFILSGPREALREARAALRKRRVPAMLLNVSLAFHHPGMRILRDLSQRRLGALAMHPARVPMLSGITAGYYPDDQPSICRYITDLDENTVAWTDCVDAMWRRDGIRHFLELGPQDTLCGLVADCEPRALCLSAGRKGHEVAAMREACARLYALGHLSLPLIRETAAGRRLPEPGKDAPAP
ncbi:MAG: acyltransferase domain-containing protein, partial [Desulfovibrio sp.]|nr:acyltransferase domain-containing protein [Desulfovibrio sp.]